MAVIKFDSEKADALIRDLKKISSDIESNMGKVYTNSYGKEINLNDSRLKVYAYRNKTIDVYNEEDGTTTQETVRERYLKNDYVANARAYNQHVRNLYKKSNTAKTKATQSIESVINSLNKIKSLISEFETEQSLRLSSSLDDVGQFDFNFLSAYGPMGSVDNYSPSLGAVVVDEAYTSLHLGILGERPTSINLEKLKVFDGMFDIAKNNELTYQEKFEQVKGLLMDNVLEVNHEEMEAKTKNALESLIGISESNDIKIDDTLRIETLVKMGVPVLENLESSNLSIDFETVGGALATGGLLADAVINGDGEEAKAILTNMDLNKDGKKDLDFDNDGNVDLPQVSKKTLESQLGIDSNVDLDRNHGGSGRGSSSNSNSGFQKNYYGQGDGGHRSADIGRGNDVGQNQQSSPVQAEEHKAFVNNGINDKGRDFGVNDIPKNEQVDNKQVVQVSHEAKTMNSAPATKDVIDSKEVTKPQIVEEHKLSSEEMALDQELQATKITNDYKDTSVSDSSNSSSVDIELDSSTTKKGAGVLAGAAGLGALSNMGGSNGATNIPQVNGMAAGEILGINSNSGSASMGMVIGDTTNASASTGNVTTTGSTTTTVGGESTADRGSLSSSNSTSKSTNTSASGRGGSTLEDKDSNNNENSYGKPNKPEDNDTTKKGMLGDASIAELEAKEEKQIKVATGVTAGTVLASGVLALANVMPWIMIILALIAIGTYVGYRIKKKKDKEKRRAALAAKQASEATATVTMDVVQNVSEVVENSKEVVTESTATADVSVEQPTITLESGGEFSSQPYEPSRDGVTEIGTTSASETEK